MKAIGAYLTDTIKRNPTTFRIFSPDELSSNKLDGVLEVTTRNFQPDPTTAHRGGRVTEMVRRPIPDTTDGLQLSEHTLQGWMQGYTLTGRHSVFPSYESFLGIVATMLVVRPIPLLLRPDPLRSNTPSLPRWHRRRTGEGILPRSSTLLVNLPWEPADPSSATSRRRPGRARSTTVWVLP